MDYEKVVEGIAEFFDGEYFCIGKTVDESQVKGDAQHPVLEMEQFDKVFVDQVGGGFTGDDFYGTAYFHIGGGRYATASY